MRTVIIDLAISINVCLTNHLVDLPVRELFAYTQKPSRVRIWKHDNLLRRRRGGGGTELTEAGHDMPQFGRRDEAIAVFVEHLERFFDLLLRVCVAHLARHHREELREINCPVAVRVDFVDHVLQLCLSRVLA